MLYIFFSLLILLPALSGIGKLFNYNFGELLSGFSGYLFSGILVSTFYFCIISFFFPLNIFLEISTILIGLTSFFYFKLWKELWIFLKLNYRIFSIVTAIILLFGSFYPFILDHFGYYVPTIKWLSEIGLSKGISNLDLLLGQMSFWHFLEAGFSHFTDLYLRLNTVLMVFYLIFILEKKSWFHFLFFPVLLLFTQSPSPDLPVIILSLIILNEILIGNKNSKLLFALSIFVFAIKPTMIWVPIFTLLYSIFFLKSKLKFIFLGSIIFLLFIIKNLYTFGFPVFPISILDFNLSWKPNAELLKISSETAIQKTYDMQYSVVQISQFSTSDYVKNWLFLNGIKSVIHWSFLILILIFTLFAFKKNKKIIYFLWISILLKSILVILFSAQYRFFIDVFFVIFFILFYQIFTKNFILITSAILTSISFTVLSFPQLLQKYIPSFKLGYFMSGISKDQFLKPAQFKLNNFSTHQIGNLKFNVVKDYPFSFDTPIPAISPEFLKEDFDAGIFPQMISNDLKDGFVWKKLTIQQHQQLKLILKDLGY
ncbi:LIC_10190 family membrane protein [Halpernia sp.]|uniref:LIC_10190 family membrane protein n=1 Tax=Halpernia sp. TaxID=2782209 RepID=UPI003A8EF0B4